MTEDRMPKLVQTSDRLEIGTNGHCIGSDEEGITIVDREGNLDKLTTGNLHVKGNLLIDTGHVTEFDVGTAVFKDKVLELGASQDITENMANGSGIEAVNNFSTIDGVIVTGLNTSTVTIEIPDMYLVESRRLSIGTQFNVINFDITSCGTVEDIYNLISKDELFISLFTIALNTEKTILTFKTANNVFTVAEVDEYVGPSIIRKETDSYKGWVIDKAIGINKQGINTTIQDGEDDFTITTADTKVVKVRENYEKDIITSDTLINKGYADLSYMSSKNIAAGIQNKGLQFIDGYIEVDTSQNGNNGYYINDSMTIIFPWLILNEDTLSKKYPLFCMYNKANPTTDGIEITTYESNQIAIWFLGEGQQWAFNVPAGTRILRPAIVIDGDNGFVNFYINGIRHASWQYSMQAHNFDTIRFGYGCKTIDKKYKGIMSGEFIILNYGLKETDTLIRVSTNVLVPYEEQWYPFGAFSSGVLREGHYYNINYVDGDFTMCGMKNESGEQLCTTTATPTWGNSSASGFGCTSYWLLEKRLDPKIDIIDLAYGRHGKIVGQVYFNEPKLEQVNIRSYV